METFVALTTVNDPGAADAIVEALNQLGIASKIDRVPDENPYMRSALLSWRIRVPPDRLQDARGALEGLALEVERELAAQAGARVADAANEADPPALASGARRRVAYATLWLAFAVPLPITCVLARAPLAGTLFLGAFIGVFVRLTTFERSSAPIELAWLLLGIKVADLVVGLAITRMRRALAKT